MPDREKTVEDLKELRSYFRAMAGIASSEEGRLNHMKSARTIEDAIILLKAQEQEVVNLTTKIAELQTFVKEPRLLQAADFQRDDADNGGAIPCWKEPKSPTRREGWAVIVYGKWLVDEGVARYWTGKPSEAKKEATPWI